MNQSENPQSLGNDWRNSLEHGAAMKSGDVTVPWLLRLRWAAITGQTATIVFCTDGLRIRLPLAPLLAVLSVALVSQLLLWGAARRRARPGRALIGGVLTLDTWLLTAVLFFTGGPHNPFSAFYLIHIAMAASLLGARWTWGLLLLAMACFGGLFWRHVPLPYPPPEEAICGWPPMQLHLIGMFVALALTGFCLAWFVARLNAQLREQAAALHAAELKSERESRFAALATLAAGVAHEINSPLATIAVTARELEVETEMDPPSATLAKDARLIRIEVERCREILGRLRAYAGDGPQDPPVEWGAAEFIKLLQASLPAAHAARLEFILTESPSRFRAPRFALLQTLANLISNALDAAPPGSPVRLEISRVANAVQFTVCDQGAGLAESVKSRIGEPFVTTKEPGQGTGLGLFLVRRFADQMGGHFRIESAPGRGTRARLELPHGAAV